MQNILFPQPWPMGRERETMRGEVLAWKNGSELKDLGWIKWVKMRYFKHFS